MTGTRAALAIVAAIVAGAPAAVAQARKPAGEVCKWCENDPKRLAAAGAVSHGPMILGKSDSNHLAQTMPGKPFLFLETPHLRIASSLDSESVSARDRPRVESLLARMREAFPKIPKRVTVLDPALRLHVFGLASESFYQRFQELLRVKDEDFPESRLPEGPFMGDGRYLGEKEKFEIVMHHDRRTHHLYTREATGATVTDALRWHLKDPHRMMVSMPAEDSDLSQDRFLYPHARHNLAHLFFCAYKHFSFDPPPWLDEGLAHAMELEDATDLNVTYCGEEGAAPERDPSSDWWARTRTLLQRDKAPSLAELVHRKSFAELKREDHVIAWSKVRFLIDEHGEKFARFLGDLKGRLDERGYPTGKDLPGAQRTLLREIWGWSLEDFDVAWKEWAAKAGPPAK